MTELMKRGLMAGGAAALLSMMMTPQALAEPVNVAERKGALAGASIFLSPGHGWLWDGERKRWSTQRGLSHGVIEDHSNAEAVMQFLVPYLENAGANVYTARERCMNTNEVVLRPGDAGVKAGDAWDLAYVPGSSGGSQLHASSTEGGGSFVEYTPEIPEDGFYAVYTWYAPVPGGKTNEAARHVIRHSGGETLWVQNQNHDHSTWKYLGTYHFEAGRNGAVTIENKASGEGTTTVAGAVRFGGGMGTVIRGGATSGKPRWEESGLYHAEYLGFTPHEDTRRFNSVSAMPMWAEWEAEPHEMGKSIYVSWHTNASGNNARGMSTFVYGPNSWGALTDFTGFPGGRELAIVVHDKVMDFVDPHYEPGWRDIGVICRWLGEVNPRNNSKMPAALFEYGFHDQPDDAAMILDPQFRRSAARATMHGIIQFYAEYMDGFDVATTPPETPVALAAVVKEGKAQLSWQAPPDSTTNPTAGDAAVSYRVYTSRNGKGFDDGRDVVGTLTEIDLPTDGSTLFVRVSAVNQGGESWPGETLAVRSGGSRGLLIVNSFDRLDRGLNLNQRGNERGILSKMNTFDYSIQHAHAAAAAGWAVDSTSNEALADGAVKLEDYDVVLWILGQEKGESVTASREHDLFEAYLNSGGRVFVSGSELVSTSAEKSFLRAILPAQTLAGGDSGSRTVKGAEGTPFAGLSFTLDDGTGRTYPVQTPDVLSGNAAFVYTDGNAGAGIAMEGKLVYLGFPFEAINEEAQRAELMARALRLLAGGGNDAASAERY